MNTRSKTLLFLLIAIIAGYLGYTFWPRTNQIEVRVYQLQPAWSEFPSAKVMFGFGRDVRLTELLVERLAAPTEIRQGMAITMSEGPGPVWRLVPADDREAGSPARTIDFGANRDKNKGDIGMEHDLRPTWLQPGVRYRITIKGKRGAHGQAEFVVEPNRKAPAGP